MKKTAMVLAGAVLFVACSRGHAREPLYRIALDDTNAALTAANDRAEAWQHAAERMARLYHQHSGHKPGKDKPRKHGRNR